MEGKSRSKEERKSEANGGEMLKKSRQLCDGGVSMTPSRFIQLIIHLIIFDISVLFTSHFRHTIHQFHYALPPIP